MRRVTASRVIGMWTRAMLDEVDPDWRTGLPDELCDPAAIRGTDPYIAHEDMTALWARYTDRHADPLFGLHFAERHAEGAVGMYSHAAAHAPDFGTAARACIQLQRLIDTHGTMTMATVAGGVRIAQVPPPGIDRWPAHLAESLAAGCIHLGRMFSGKKITPREACFQHSFSGRDVTSWFGSAVRYDQPWNALVFDDATLEIPFRHADATHFTAMVAAVSRTLDELAPAVGIVDEARARLRARQGQKTSLATLARLLKISERSLQRRLAEAGVTFRQLADEVRMSTLAQQATKPQKGRVTAEALGYADPSSIRRLRKRARRR